MGGLPATHAGWRKMNPKETVFPEVLASRPLRAREGFKFNSQDLSERARVPLEAMERYLQGKSVPGEREIARLAGALGITPDWLLGDDASFRRNKRNILSFAGRLDGTGKLWFISERK